MKVGASQHILYINQKYLFQFKNNTHTHTHQGKQSFSISYLSEEENNLDIVHSNGPCIRFIPH